MKKSFFIIFHVCIISLLLLGFSNCNPDSKYTGLVSKDNSKELKFNFLAVIEPGYDIVSYTIRLKQMLWLEKNSKDSKGNIIDNKILDIIISPEKNNYSFCYSCLLNGKYNKYIVTITKKEGTSFISKPIYAWRINLTTEKFEKISIEGISCINPSDLD